MQDSRKARTEQQKRKPLARLWFGGLPDWSRAFALSEGVRGWIFWTRCGMGL